MKKLFIVSLLLLVSFINSQGQWYVKKYNISDINFLSQGQLEESLAKSKSDFFVSVAVSGFGGAVFLIFRYLRPGMGEDPSFFEQLIGDEGVNKLGMAIGTGFVAGGIIAGISYLGRIGRIKSVINKNYPGTGSLNISPSIFCQRYARSYCRGVTLTYNF